MSSKKNPHVVSHVKSKGWAVKLEDCKRATSIHNTQKEAIDAAKKIAKDTESELFIHNRKGKIRERNSYGNDPYPPKG